MKFLILGLSLLLLSIAPIRAQSASNSGQIQGLYDDDTNDATYSATASATPTPQPRTTTLNPADTPISGAIENTIALLLGGMTLMFVGFRFSKS